MNKWHNYYPQSKKNLKAVRFL